MSTACGSDRPPRWSSSRHSSKRPESRAVRVDDREQPLDAAAGFDAGNSRGLEHRLAGPHPVAVAADGVDLAVVRDEPVRVRQRPGRERVGGEPGVHQGEVAARTAGRTGQGRTAQAAARSACPCRRWSGRTGSRSRHPPQGPRPSAQRACAGRRRGGPGPGRFRPPCPPRTAERGAAAPHARRDRTRRCPPGRRASRGRSAPRRRRARPPGRRHALVLPSSSGRKAMPAA